MSVVSYWEIRAKHVHNVKINTDNLLYTGPFLLYKSKYMFIYTFPRVRETESDRKSYLILRLSRPNLTPSSNMTQIVTWLTGSIKPFNSAILSRNPFTDPGQ